MRVHLPRLIKLGIPLAAVVLPTMGVMSVSAQTVTAYSFGPPPIASAGSLGPGQSVNVTLRAKNGNTPVPGASVYLSYTTTVSGDSVTLPSSQCGGTTQLTPGQPVACTTDSNGSVVMAYAVPAAPPGQGHADFLAGDSSSNPSITGHDHYVYATNYRFSPSPIAAGGKLTAGASVSVTMSAENALDGPLTNSAVYLSFKAASGGGTASVSGSSALTSTPTLYHTDGSGAIHLTYKAPASLPAGGQDAIVAQDSTSSPQAINTDYYAFSTSTPVVSVGDAAIVEGDTHPGIPLKFTVTLSPPQPAATTVQYTTSCGVGDKVCSEDYPEALSPVTLTIPANATSTSVIVRAYSYVGDHAGETYVEGLFVHLLNPSGAVLGRSVGEGIILPDVENTSTALALLSVGNVGVEPTVDPGHIPLYFTVTLGATEGNDVSFSYATADGTAVGGTDYTPASGTAVIPAGSTSVVIKVWVLPNALPSSSRTFTLTISNPTGGPTIQGATGVGTILAG